MTQIFLSFCMGVIGAAALPHAGWMNATWDLTPYNFPIVALSLYALYYYTWTADAVSLRAVFARTYAWAFGYFLLGLNWIGNALLIDGNDFAWAWPFAVLGLPVILSFFLSVTFVIAHRLAIQKTPITFAATFTLGELARGYLFTGFPWNLPAYYWAETLPVFQTLALVGPYGLTFLTVWWGVALCAHIKAPRTLAIPAFVFITLLAFGFWRLHTPIQDTPSSMNIVMVQPNIPQSEKWNGEKAPEHFETHLTLSLDQAKNAHAPTAIIWPEAALPPSYVDDPGVNTAIKNLLSLYPPGSALLAGAVYTNTPTAENFYNGIVAYTSSDTQKVYAKFHLVPFGEYIPFQRFIPIGPVAEFDNLTPGPGPQTVTVGTLPPFRPLVCYEVIFPSAVYKNRGDAKWILNVTNDAWYGNSPGPYQHLAQARARTIESGLPLVRVAGTGISMVINPYGQDVASLDYGVQKSIFLQAPFSTINYTIYNKLGDGILIFAIFLTAIYRNAKKFIPSLTFWRIAKCKD